MEYIGQFLYIIIIFIVIALLGKAVGFALWVAPKRINELERRIRKLENKEDK